MDRAGVRRRQIPDARGLVGAVEVMAAFTRNGLPRTIIAACIVAGKAAAKVGDRA